MQVYLHKSYNNLCVYDETVPVILEVIYSEDRLVLS